MPLGSDRSEVTAVHDDLDSDQGKMRVRCGRWRTSLGVWGDLWLVDDVSVFAGRHRSAWAWCLQTDGTVQGREPLEVRKLRCTKGWLQCVGDAWGTHGVLSTEGS